MNSIVYVYTLCDPADDAVRYVGVTRFPDARERRHCRPDGTKKGKWVSALAARGVRPRFVIIETATESNWQEREQFWIAEYGRRGAKLMNGDAGGLNRVRHSEELKARISATLSGRPNAALSKAVFAFRKDGAFAAEYPSLATAATALGASHCNISRAIKSQTACAGHFWLFERREAYLPERYATGSYQASKETRARLSAAVAGKCVGRVFSDETKAKMRAAAVAKHARNRKASHSEVTPCAV